MDMLLAVKNEIETCYGATNVSKGCPYCKTHNVTYDKVLFGVVTSAMCECGKKVYIEMLDLLYYRMW